MNVGDPLTAVMIRKLEIYEQTQEILNVQSDAIKTAIHMWRRSQGILEKIHTAPRLEYIIAWLVAERYRLQKEVGEAGQGHGEYSKQPAHQFTKDYGDDKSIRLYEAIKLAVDHELELRMQAVEKDRLERQREAEAIKRRNVGRVRKPWSS